MASDKRKTGLGVDVFFPSGQVQTGDVEKTTEAGEHKKENPSPEAIPSSPPSQAVVSQNPKQSVVPSPVRQAKKKTIEAKRKDEEQPAMPQATQTIKLTVMVDADKFDQLEELKRQERRRLRAAGGEAGRNWRQQVTITYFIDQALAEFLAKKGFKQNKA